MTEIERAKALLQGEFAKLNEKLKDAGNRGPEGGNLFSVKAYTDGLTQINAALCALKDYAKGVNSGVRRIKAKRDSDTAS